MGRVGIVTREGLQAKLTVHEDDGISSFKKVFGGGSTTGSFTSNLNICDYTMSNEEKRTSTEIIQETDSATHVSLVASDIARISDNAHTLSSRGTVVPPLYRSMSRSVSLNIST